MKVQCVMLLLVLSTHFPRRHSHSRLPTSKLTSGFFHAALRNPKVRDRKLAPAQPHAGLEGTAWAKDSKTSARVRHDVALLFGGWTDCETLHGRRTGHSPKTEC